MEKSLDKLRNNCSNLDQTDSFLSVNLPTFRVTTPYAFALMVTLSIIELFIKTTSSPLMKRNILRI